MATFIKVNLTVLIPGVGILRNWFNCKYSNEDLGFLCRGHSLAKKRNYKENMITKFCCQSQKIS